MTTPAEVAKEILKKAAQAAGVVIAKAVLKAAKRQLRKLRKHP